MLIDAGDYVRGGHLPCNSRVYSCFAHNLAFDVLPGPRGKSYLQVTCLFKCAVRAQLTRLVIVAHWQAFGHLVAISLAWKLIASGSLQPVSAKCLIHGPRPAPSQRHSSCRSYLLSYAHAEFGFVRKVLYVIPTGQNPSGATMPEARRREVYALAQRHNLIILEDDPYFHLQLDKVIAVQFCEQNGLPPDTPPFKND